MRRQAPRFVAYELYERDERDERAGGGTASLVPGNARQRLGGGLALLALDCEVAE